jgi:hypothetical protein
MTEDLDRLLAQPLAEIPDNGFSSRTSALLELQRLRRSRFLTEIYAGLVVLAVLVLPFTRGGAALASAASTHVGIVLIGLGTATILLVSLVKRPSANHLAI